MAYDTNDIEIAIKTYIKNAGVIFLGDVYTISPNDQNELFVENMSTNRRYALEDALLCLNEETFFFSTLLPEYVTIHKLLKKWYDDIKLMDNYYV